MSIFTKRNLIFFILLLSLAYPLQLLAQTTPISFTNIPFSNADLNAPGRGAEQWHNGNEVDIPVEGTSTPRLDVYYRFQWYELETTQNVYDWAKFDTLINRAIRARQKFSFGIMTVYSDPPVELRNTFEEGGYGSYPEYLHDLMQGETIKDWQTNEHGDTTGNDFMWVPNWNSDYYLTRLLALNTALNTHINNTSHQGVAYKHVIGYVDIRGYGNYGEWHEGNIVEDSTQHPAGTRATKATQKAIIDAHIDGFPNFPLVAMIATFDAFWLQNTMNFPETAYYILTASNNWGKIGWRRDSYGASDSYISSYLENNTRSASGASGTIRFDTVILKRYLFAPIVGEPIYGGNYTLLPAQVRLYGTASFGNGNYGVTLTSTLKDSIRAASKAAGYRIILDSGRTTTALSPGSAFSITLYWKNIGLAPTYEHWKAVYELKNSGGTVVWSGNSSFQLKLFPPGSNAGNTDNFTLPSNIPAGNYDLNLIIKDTAGFRAPFPLAITGRNGDGSYTLRSLTIGCTKPTAVLANVATCNGQAFNLTLASATGVSPYDLVINGVTYNDKTVGNTITSFTPPAYKIWDSNPSVSSNEDDAVELGVKFVASQSGYIKGLRFYSPNNASGTYTGHLWDSAGTLLATATFTSVTTSAWQEVLFETPVPVLANKRYIASYYTAGGRYASTTSGLTSAVTNGPLSALAGGSSGGNGVYKYGTSGFPTSSFSNSNYWADVLFVADTYTFNLTSVTDSVGCDSTGALQTLIVTKPTAVLANSATCNGQAFNVTLASAIGASPYDLVINGVTYNDKTVGNTIISVTPPTYKIWDSNPSVSSNEDDAVELGVKFVASQSGYIKGLRFYSPNNASGTYTGHLWDSAGTLLATATFTSVTTSAWQEVLFETPVPVLANKRYIASYYTAGGRYASTTSGLTSAVTNGPLTALAGGSSGGNGVYKYGTSGFPTSSFSNSNYWADVLFVADTYTFNLTSVTDNNGCSSTGSLQTLTVTSAVCGGGGRTSNPALNIPTEEKLEYSLGQSFPNPTYAQANIIYTIPVKTKVNLQVFDVHGRLIRVLVNETKEKGTHKVNINASALAKGVYYYKMQVKGFSATRKFIIQ